MLSHLIYDITAMDQGYYECLAASLALSCTAPMYIQVVTE